MIIMDALVVSVETGSALSHDIIKKAGDSGRREMHTPCCTAVGHAWKNNGYDA